MSGTGRFDNKIEAMASSVLREQYQDQIERAIRNAKRTAWDKRFRSEWYRAAAMREWPERRQRAFAAWRRQ